MTRWYKSLNGALVLTALAWVSELWRAWLDMLFQYPGGYVNAQKDGVSTIVLTVVYTAFFAGWAYAMYRTAVGSLGGLVATFMLNALVWLVIPVGYSLFWCTGACVTNAGFLMTLGNWLNLILGLLAGISLAWQRRE